MNKRFSMLPGGGLWQRYQWVRFRRAVDDLNAAFIKFGVAAQQAAQSIASVAQAFDVIA